MLFTPDGWVGFGVALIICGVVVAFATGIGKAIIWLFGAEHGVVEKREDKATVRSEIREVA